MPFKTFTIYYKGRGQMDERAWAREVVSAYPNLEPTYYAPSDQEVTECFDTASKASDVPMMSSPGLSTYFVMKLAAKRKIKVLLSGDGADEYLAGYWPAYDRLIGGQIKRGRWLKSAKFTPGDSPAQIVGLCQHRPARAAERCRGAPK